MQRIPFDNRFIDNNNYLWNNERIYFTEYSYYQLIGCGPNEYSFPYKDETGWWWECYDDVSEISENNIYIMFQTLDNAASALSVAAREANSKYSYKGYKDFYNFSAGYSYNTSTTSKLKKFNSLSTRINIILDDINDYKNKKREEFYKSDEYLYGNAVYAE